MTHCAISDPPGPPDAPTITEIFKDSCIVNWEAPKNNGGSAIIGYHVERRMTTSSRWAKLNTDRISEKTLHVTDLKDHSEYEFRVSAENKAGVGEPSPPSKPFTAKDPWGEF